MRLAVEGLAVGFGDRLLFADAAFSLEGGQVLCLLGPNGSGKSTLFRTLLGLVAARAGSVLVDGQDTAHWPRRRLARALAYVPQATVTQFPFSVRQMVLMGRAAHVPALSAPGPGDHAGVALLQPAQRTIHCAPHTAALHAVHFGGQRQLCLVARALAQQGGIVLMDEPTASLDFGNQMRVLACIRELAAAGLGVLFASHDPDHAFQCASHAMLLADGHLGAPRPPAEAITGDSLARLYGVDVEVVALPGHGGRRVCVPRAGQPVR